MLFETFLNNCSPQGFFKRVYIILLGEKAKL